MVRPLPFAACCGALLASAPLDPASAQRSPGLSTRTVVAPDMDRRSSEPPRFDPLRLREDEFGQPYDLFGIPLTGERGLSRERGFSFGVRPAKGIRAIARLRF